MIQEFQPVISPWSADRYVELYLIAPLLFLGLCCCLFWLLKSLYFYASNGFDLRQSFGPDVTVEETGKPLGPVGKLFVYFFAVVFLGGFLFLVVSDKI